MAEPKRSSDLVYGIDCRLLGIRYASALIGNSNFMLHDLLDLQKHSTYVELPDLKKSTVESSIKAVAKKVLLDAGFNENKVNTILHNK